MEKTPIFNYHKAKIRRLHNKRVPFITIDTHKATLFQGEMQSHFHLLQMRKRRVSRMNTSAIDNGLVVRTIARRILHIFLKLMQNKYDPIWVDDACVSRMEKAGHRTFRLEWRDFQDPPISEVKQMASMSKGSCMKAPGINGMCLEFFKVHWGNIKHDMLAVFNQKYLDVRIMEQMKHGILVCIPKTDIPSTPADCRQIT